MAARSLRLLVERLAVAHFVAYPIAFLTAVAAIPLAMYLHLEELERLGDANAIGMAAVRLVAWPAGIAFLLAHVSVARWAFGRDEVRGRRWFLRAVGALAGAIVLFGSASWLWLYLR